MKRLLFTLALMVVGVAAFGQKKKDNLITVVSVDSSSVVFRNMYQHLIDNGYEVTNKDEKVGYLSAKQTTKSLGAAEMKVAVSIKQTDSTRAAISGTYTANSMGMQVAGPIFYNNTTKSALGIMWGNMVKLAKAHPNGVIRYSKRD